MNTVKQCITCKQIKAIEHFQVTEARIELQRCYGCRTGQAPQPTKGTVICKFCGRLRPLNPHTPCHHCGRVDENRKSARVGESGS